MKVTDRTMQVLKNFATINSNIFIEEGNVLRTVSESKTVLSRAEIDMQFPKSFGIYDLGEYLGVMGLVDSPNVDFSDDYVTVSDEAGRTKIKYFYSSPDILTTVQKDISSPSEDAWFTLDRDTRLKITRAAATLGHSEMIVTVVDGIVTLTVTDPEDTTANAFSVAVDGESTTDDLNAVISISNLKMMEGDYRVSLSSKMISHFVNTESNSQYWVALQKNSSF